jgi:NADH:ubiquinone oxidoreductase subunit K
MRKMKGSLSRRNFWLILVVTAIMLTAFPFLVRPFSQQSNDDSPSPQPFTFFILPETSTFSEPTIPILVAVILPSELSQITNSLISSSSQKVF